MTARFTNEEFSINIGLSASLSTAINRDNLDSIIWGAIKGISTNSTLTFFTPDGSSFEQIHDASGAALSIEAEAGKAYTLPPELYPYDEIRIAGTATATAKIVGR